MKIRFILLQLFLSSSVFAQGYYPLSVGNVWEYYCADFYTPETYEYSAMIVGDTLMPNGHTYAIERTTTNQVTLLRQDGPFVLEYATTGESIIYDFTVHSGDTVRVEYYYPSPGEPETLITTVNVTNWEWFGKQRKIWSYITEFSWGDAVLFHILADSIGFIHSWQNMHGLYCGSAMIDGIRYGTILTVPLNPNESPQQFVLNQNYPNPFNSSTQISFSLHQHSFVSLKIYDVLGRTVATVINERQDAGEHRVEWDAGNNPSGVYFYRLDATSVVDHSKIFTQVKKMILMK